jgi:hypothetical protein
VTSAPSLCVCAPFKEPEQRTLRVCGSGWFGRAAITQRPAIACRWPTRPPTRRSPVFAELLAVVVSCGVWGREGVLPGGRGRGSLLTYSPVGGWTAQNRPRGIPGRTGHLEPAVAQWPTMPPARPLSRPDACPRHWQGSQPSADSRVPHGPLGSLTPGLTPAAVGEGFRPCAAVGVYAAGARHPAPEPGPGYTTPQPPAPPHVITV